MHKSPSHFQPKFLHRYFCLALKPLPVKSIAIWMLNPVRLTLWFSPVISIKRPVQVQTSCAHVAIVGWQWLSCGNIVILHISPPPCLAYSVYLKPGSKLLACLANDQLMLVLWRHIVCSMYKPRRWGCIAAVWSSKSRAKAVQGYSSHHFCRSDNTNGSVGMDFEDLSEGLRII